MTRRGRRLTMIGAALGLFGLAVGLALYALRGNIVFFYSPTEMKAQIDSGKVREGVRLRIGGLVEQGSVVRDQGRSVAFVVTDGKGSVPIAYTGMLPDLFREGQGVVAEGSIDATGTFRADNILAKHDERYMPREVADALKKQGVWQGGGVGAQGMAR